jgi:hypothetical protein
MLIRARRVVRVSALSLTRGCKSMGAYNPGMRLLWAVLLPVLVCSCADRASDPDNEQSRVAVAPADAAHQNVTGPHGDHTPHHGGLVLMNGDVHYEVVFDPNGRHEVWFTDAVRRELPASVASGVTMEVARPGAAVETLALAIDDAGEAWVANGRPLAGEGVMVKVRYALQGEPYEIEVPVVSGVR